MKIAKGRVAESINQFQTRDPALYEELNSRIIDELPEEGVDVPNPPVGRRETLALAEELPDHADVPESVRAEITEYERRVSETIVRPNARPVMAIRDNKVTTEFLGPDSQIWADRIRAASTVLDAVIPAIGRVELKNNPDFAWVGTGWLVADDVIVTNRHVAREFARGGPSGFTFRTGINDSLQAANIDFLEEFERAASAEFDVESVLWIAKPNDPDVAFLKVKRPVPNRSLPRPIPLARDVSPDDFVVTIGYPARDSRVPDQELVKRIFGDVYEKKRLAPGQVTDVGVDELQHDCSTLGGNSGSPVIDLKTGEAVGLHFSGLFLESNFAVPASTVDKLLTRLQRSELPGMAPIEIRSNTAVPQTGTSPIATMNSNTFTFQFQIPVEITVKVGGTPVQAGGPAAPVAPAADEHLFENALAGARVALSGHPDILDVRLGYRFKRGWITDERVVVVEVRKKLTATELRETGRSMIPNNFSGVGVDVRTAALFDQLEHLGVDLEALEARARPGAYREPPDLSLDPVRDAMKATFHVSPDSGFPNLKAFFGRVKKRLTATMYEWEAEHISTAIEDAISPSGNSLKMVTQKRGTQAAVEDLKTRLNSKFRHRWASVGSGKIVPSAYHIKVASRDGEEFWLSSGNWKDSNQANIDPAGTNSTSTAPLRQHNREWHAIIEHPKLATLFQKYIEWDYDEAGRVPFEEGLEPTVADQYLFVPEAAFFAEEARFTPKYFDPLLIDRVLEVQPLLTPDRDARGRRKFIDCATAMINKATRKVYVQNQSFNFLDDNVDEFEQFFGAVREKQQAGLDVRIIFRDGREFGSANGPKQQELLERLKDFGLDTDLIRVQMRCHTKAIIIDAPENSGHASGEVLLGSHNLTNEGALYNRDASLLVRDGEVARYFEQIFLFDWEHMATQESDELVGDVRVARSDEATPPGFRRVSVRELLGLD